MAHMRTSAGKSRRSTQGALSPGRLHSGDGGAAATTSTADRESYFNVDLSPLAAEYDGSLETGAGVSSLAQLMQQLELIVPHTTIVGATALVRRYLTQRHVAPLLLHESDVREWNPWCVDAEPEDVDSRGTREVHVQTNACVVVSLYHCMNRSLVQTQRARPP
jgi:hypothetical protein